MTATNHVRLVAIAVLVTHLLLESGCAQRPPLPSTFSFAPCPMGDPATARHRSMAAMIASLDERSWFVEKREEHFGWIQAKACLSPYSDKCARFEFAIFENGRVEAVRIPHGYDPATLHDHVEKWLDALEATYVRNRCGTVD